MVSTLAARVKKKCRMGCPLGCVVCLFPVVGRHADHASGIDVLHQRNASEAETCIRLSENDLKTWAVSLGPEARQPGHTRESVASKACLDSGQSLPTRCSSIAE